jgi:hypothetical protein
LIDRTSPLSRNGELSLSFSTGHEAGEIFAHGDSYVASIKNRDGIDVLTFRLPTDLVDQVVLARTGVAVSISLSGDVIADIESKAIDSAASQQLALDILVAQAIEPAMLQDEPEAGELLRSLRQKLETAIRAVDSALLKVSTR